MMFMAMRYTSYMMLESILPNYIKSSIKMSYKYLTRLALNNITDLLLNKESGDKYSFAS